MRLYRVGPLPSEAAQLAAYRRDRQTMSPWVVEYEKESDLTDARGRWFTSDRVMAEHHKADYPLNVLRHIELPDDEAARWSVENNPDLRKYATEDKNEYFLPPEIADTAVPTED